MRPYLSFAAVCSAALLVSGCGGGGTSSPTSSAITPSTANGHLIGSAKVKLSVAIPLRKVGAAKSNRRRAKYVSPATAELAIRAGTAGGGIATAAWQLFDVAANASDCTSTGAVRTCVLTITAPVVQGAPQDEFQVTATDTEPQPGDTQPEGDYLSGGDTTAPVSLGIQNNISILLTGIIGSLTTDAAGYSVWAAPGSSANVTVNITALDAAGGQIAGDPPTFQNPITFADTLSPSPFTYPSGNLNSSPPNYGLPAPAAPGPIPATIGYTAPTTGTSLTTTVTVATDYPDYLPAPTTPPGTTFTLNPLVASVAGVPIATIPGLSVSGGTPVTVSVTETGASSFTVTPSAAGSFTLLASPGVPLTGPITATNGVATFIVQPVAATTTPAPTITVTDATGTAAVLNAPVAP